MIGQLLGGRYLITNHLGGGGFGQTYLAKDQQLPSQPECVVKQFKPQFNDPESLVTAKRLFDREAETLYHLGHHDLIPRLLAHFTENQEFYLVEEFIVGHSLNTELIPAEFWSEKAVIQLLINILEPLSFLHQNNIIHRDIKPPNLIRRKKDNKIVLIDFGAVKQLTTKIDVNNHSALTIAIGTPGYMPTEQATGKPRLSSDIYAVGMIGIQALTGKIPSLLPENVETGEIVWQNYLNIHAKLEAILSRMIRYDYRQRYQSAQEVLQDLAELNITVKQSNQPINSLPLSINNYQNNYHQLADINTKIEDHYNNKNNNYNNHYQDNSFATNLNRDIGIEFSTYDQLDKKDKQSDHQLTDKHQSRNPVNLIKKKGVFLSLIFALLGISGIAIYYFHPSKPTEIIDPLRNPNFSPRFISDTRLTKMEDINKICQSKGKLPLYYTTEVRGPLGFTTFQGRMDFSIHPDKACNYDYRGTFVDRGSDGQICTGYVRLFPVETDEAGISKIYASWKVTGDRSCASRGRNPTLILYRDDLFK
jgi:serine/threonine protein kinase